ncbi:hypothetical protein CMI47_15725 [Candidatus Pacearchaeota archaeon]|nr:hypothetical protein [Candidatus Pacearchaeota archaeon]
MKSQYQIEQTAEWHYDKKQPPNKELRYVGDVKVREIDSIVKDIIERPYELGGIKRVHSGDPALSVANTSINKRSQHMREIGYTPDHYFIEFNNEIVDDFAENQKKIFNLSYEHHCVILIPPGQCMPVHGDTYSYLMRFMKRDNPEVEYNLKENARRYLTFFTDWEWGQVLGAGNVLQWQWNKGETFVWDHKLIHWSANAGFEPMVFFEITGLEL